MMRALVVAFLLSPSQAWVVGPRQLVTSPPKVEAEPTKLDVAELSRKVSSFGVGCVLAAATTFGVLGGPAPAFADAGRFSYDPALGGPETWSTLKVEGNQCNGRKQSPISIRETGCNVGANYQMSHGTCTSSDLGYVLGRNGPKANFPSNCGGNTLKIPFVEGTFEAVQFHTHVGSEHTIGGKSYGAEFHIVHKQTDGDRFAVVGIMINGDAVVDNPKFQKLLNGWDAVEAKTKEECDGEVSKKKPRSSTQPFDVYDLIPASSNFYFYDGSLTTPPCSEVVWWNVADVPLSISPAQFDKLVKYHTQYTDPKTCELDPSASPVSGGTNRPVAQDNLGRKVLRICPVNFFQ